MRLLNEEHLQTLQPKEIVARLESLEANLEPLMGLKLLNEKKLYNKVKKYLQVIKSRITFMKQVERTVRNTYTTHVCKKHHPMFYNLKYYVIYCPICEIHTNIKRRHIKLYNYYMCKTCGKVSMLTRIRNKIWCNGLNTEDDSHRRGVDKLNNKQRPTDEKSTEVVYSNIPTTFTYYS